MAEWIIDADTHLTEPAGTWTDYVPAKFRDMVPLMVRDDHGNDIWTLNGKFMGHVGLTALAGWDEPFPSGPARLDECHPASYDATARLAYMDGNNIWAQVVYPNVGGFGNQRFLMMKDAELKLACVRAYNDFQRDWASPDPRRLITLISTPFWDIDETVAEVQRAAAMGHRGILFTGEPQAFGLPLLGDPHWDPLWAVARDTDMPIHFHIGSGDMSKAMPRERTVVSGDASSYAFMSINLFMNNGIQMCDLLLSTVLLRFPEVKFVSVESGIGWIPFLLEACDYHVTQANVAGRDRFTELPSESFRRSVYACYWFEDVAPRNFLELMPADNLLFETDFPHPTCLYGNIAERIENSLGGQPREVQRKILWDNAARLYDVAEPDVAAVGVGATL